MVMKFAITDRFIEDSNGARGLRAIVGVAAHVSIFHDRIAIHQFSRSVAGSIEQGGITIIAGGDDHSRDFQRFSNTSLGIFHSLHPHLSSHLFENNSFHVGVGNHFYPALLSKG